MKKHTFLTWFTICAVLAGLVVSCWNPAGPGGSRDAAKATVTVRLAGGAERTLMPSDVPELEEFDNFTLTFTPAFVGAEEVVLEDLSLEDLQEGVDQELTAGN